MGRSPRSVRCGVWGTVPIRPGERCLSGLGNGAHPVARVARDGYEAMTAGSGPGRAWRAEPGSASRPCPRRLAAQSTVAAAEVAPLGQTRDAEHCERADDQHHAGGLEAARSFAELRPGGEHTDRRYGQRAEARRAR